MMTSFWAHVQRYRLVYGVLVVLVCMGTAWAAYRYMHKVRYKGVSRIQIDMRQPDMVLATRNLSELPKDVAHAPLLQGLVDEEFVFHYEEDPVRLSVEGSLRRLAYEHHLTLPDHLLAEVLSAPAEVGIWRSSKGRAEHFVLALERKLLAKWMDVLIRVGLDDRQLRSAGEFTIAGRRVPILTLELGGGRTLAFVAAGERWVFMSDPALALDGSGQLTADAADVLAALLSGKRPWQSTLPTDADSKHSLAIGSKALTLSYAAFAPALTGLRLNYGEHGWQPELRLNTQALPAQYNTTAQLAALWRQVPSQAAACAALPVGWTQVAKSVQALLSESEAVTATVNALDPLAAVCWFADSRLNAPLFVVQAHSDLPAQHAAVMEALARTAWRNGAQAEQTGEVARYGAFVPSRHGLRLPSAVEPGFSPTLARKGRLLFFSPDRRLVDAALAVANKTAPALADLKDWGDKPVWLYYDPQRVGALVRNEVQEVLPADEESFLRDVARQRLWPRLENWGKQQAATALSAGATGAQGFTRLDFVPIGQPKASTQ